MILKKLVVGPYASNCYIYGSPQTKEGVIIDAGADGDRILKNVRDMGLTIKAIVLTHAHMDHIGAITKVRNATGAGVAIHRDDAGLLKHGYDAKPDRLLVDGDSFSLGETSLRVLHTPGHSPGSISLLGDGLVFTGDTLFNYGIGRYDLAGGSYSLIMNSISTRLMALPDDTVVHPGHGPETTIGAERQGNPFLHS